MASHTAREMGFTVWTTVWMALNSLKAKRLAERVGFEFALEHKFQGHAEHWLCVLGMESYGYSPNCCVDVCVPQSRTR
jgi:hypothetical protein